MKPLDHADVLPWQELARADLAMADLALADPHSTAAMYGLVCFHAQQAAEKSLKAALIAADRPAPRTHSLVLLLDTCAGPTAAPDETLRAAAALNEYGIGPRYPGSYPPATLAQARAARADADAVCGWALARFG